MACRAVDGLVSILEHFRQVKASLEANPEALRAFGFQRSVSFVTPETAGDGDGLLVTVYEVDDPAELERFQGLEAIVEQVATLSMRLGEPRTRQETYRRAGR